MYCSLHDRIPGDSHLLPLLVQHIREGAAKPDVASLAHALDGLTNASEGEITGAEEPVTATSPDQAERHASHVSACALATPFTQDIGMH